MSLKIEKGECYAVNRWYNVIATICTDTDDDVEIICSVSVADDETSFEETILQVTVTNPEELPPGITEENLVSEIESKWHEL